MEKSYAIRVTENDPRLRLKLPKEMHEKLEKRARENGRDLNIEIMLRFARTLERDVYRDQNDEIFEKVFFMRDED